MGFIHNNKDIEYHQTYPSEGPAVDIIHLYSFMVKLFIRDCNTIDLLLYTLVIPKLASSVKLAVLTESLTWEYCSYLCRAADHSEAGFTRGEDHDTQERFQPIESTIDIN